MRVFSRRHQWHRPADLIFADANPAFLRQAGRSRDQVVGRYLFDVFPDNPLGSPGSAPVACAPSRQRNSRQTPPACLRALRRPRAKRSGRSDNLTAASARTMTLQASDACFPEALPESVQRPQGEDMFGRHLIVAGVTTVLLAGLAACSSGSGGADEGTGYVVAADNSGGAATGQKPPEPDTVSGRRDTVRHLPVETARATRPRLVRTCTTGTRRVSHTSSSGAGARRRTRTWYTSERYTSCRKVSSGTESYRRTVRPEKWCVRLDDVDGDNARDDIWYQVTRAVYDKARDTDKHARMEFTPTGDGC